VLRIALDGLGMPDAQHSPVSKPAPDRRKSPEMRILA
jgi:hypothetical protein